MVCRFSSWGYMCNMRQGVCLYKVWFVCTAGFYAVKIMVKAHFWEFMAGKRRFVLWWKFSTLVSIQKSQLFGFGMEHVFCNSLSSQVLHLICHKFCASALTWQSVLSCRPILVKCSQSPLGEAVCKSLLVQTSVLVTAKRNSRKMKGVIILEMVSPV